MDAQRLANELQGVRLSQALLRKHLFKRRSYFPPVLWKELEQTLGVADFAIANCETNIDGGSLGDALTCLVAAAGAVGVSAGILAALNNDGVRDIMRSYTARLGADVTNAAKSDAKDTVRELWFKLPERERARRGSVLSFATATALIVKNTTVDGIRRWVAGFRKEPSSR